VNKSLLVENYILKNVHKNQEGTLSSIKKYKTKIQNKNTKQNKTNKINNNKKTKTKQKPVSS